MSIIPSTISSKAYVRYAWFVLIYTLFVILLGAFVRATGSGAGCGDHWPLCQGRLLVEPTNYKTWIEFTHRITSGFDLLLVMALPWLRTKVSFSLFSHALIKRACRQAVAFILIEALVGAAIVLLRYVDQDSSWQRAVVVSFHLANTLLLMNALYDVCYHASHPAQVQLPGHRRNLSYPLYTLFFYIIAMMGAVTALGDTLFSADSLRDGFDQDLNPLSHFLIRLRVVHPVLAVLWSATAFLYARGTRAYALKWVIGLQVAFGIVNLGLLAPLWAQMVHLLLANVLWIAWLHFGHGFSEHDTLKP